MNDTGKSVEPPKTEDSSRATVIKGSYVSFDLKIRSSSRRRESIIKCFPDRNCILNKRVLHAEYLINTYVCMYYAMGSTCDPMSVKLASASSMNTASDSESLTSGQLGGGEPENDAYLSLSPLLHP